MRRPGIIWIFAALASASAAMADDTATPAGEEDVNAIIKDYCSGIIDKAAEARLAWQRQELEALGTKVEAKIAELDKRRAETETWVMRQEAILKSASESLVEIYAKVDPETAASQLAQVGQGTAVSIISQLKPKDASAILDEMEPDVAARLVKAMASPLAAKPGGGS